MAKLKINTSEEGKKIQAWQKKLGVKQDGWWGDDTQKAFIGGLNKANPNKPFPEDFKFPEGTKLEKGKFIFPKTTIVKQANLVTPKQTQSNQARKFHQDASLDPSDFVAPTAVGAAAIGGLLARKSIGRFIGNKVGLLFGKKPVYQMGEKVASKMPFKVDLSKLEQIAPEKEATNVVNFRNAPYDKTPTPRAGGQRLLENLAPKDALIKAFKANRVAGPIAMQTARKIQDITPILKKNPLRLPSGEPGLNKMAMEQAKADMRKEGRKLIVRKKRS